MTNNNTKKMIESAWIRIPTREVVSYIVRLLILLTQNTIA